MYILLRIEAEEGILKNGGAHTRSTYLVIDATNIGKKIAFLDLFSDIYIYIYILYIQGVPKKLCFTFLLISQLILIVEKRVGYPQNWHGKRLPTICDSTFSVTWFTRKLTF